MARILFLSSWLPEPADNGSKLRVLHLLRALHPRHETTLFALAIPRERPITGGRLDELCSRVRVFPRRDFEPRRLRARAALLHPSPRAVVDTFDPSLAAALKDELTTRRYDLVIASQWRAAAYHRTFTGVPALYEEVELGALAADGVRPSLLRSRLRRRLTLLKLGAYLRRQLPRFAACTVASEEERRLLARWAPGHPPAEVIPNAVDLSRYDGFDGPREAGSMVFAGPLVYRANHDAMTWFLEAIYPSIRDQLPEATLAITGEHGDLPLPPAPGVVRTGRLDDVRPQVARSRVSLAPLRIGGGTRLKILEALALRTPVVATSKGAEGLDVEDGIHLLVADRPEDFTTRVVRLLRDEDLAHRLGAAGRQRVEERYEAARVGRRFLDLVDRILAAG